MIPASARREGLLREPRFARGVEMTFPPFPRSNEEIRTYAGHGEPRFRDALVEGLDILSRSTGITTPAGWLVDFLKKEAGL